MAKTDIPMVNLSDQYLAIKEEIDAAILDTVASTQFINGPQVKDFEQRFAEYLGVKHVVGCANGTDALQVAFMSLGFEEGDEVITPSFTYAATAEVLGLLKLTPVFVDVEPDTFNIDAKKIEMSISARTKAILPVHLFGAAADMDAIGTIADKYGLHVIEDTAQACGSSFKGEDGSWTKVGSIGNMSTFSFFPSKNLGCFGDGGAIATNDDKLAAKARMIAKHGQSKKYIHDVIGCNSRLDSIQAAVLNVKLNKLEEYNEKRRLAAKHYGKLLKGIPGITIPGTTAYSHHIYHQYTIKVESNRDGLAEHLKANGIGCAIYYPIPLHEQKAFISIPTRKGELEVTETIKDQVLSLPMDTELNLEQQQYICNTIKNFINS